MVNVTAFDGKEFFINCDLIETIKETPDTVIALSNGKKLIVKESSEEIVERVIEFRRKILTGICIEKEIKD